jgi:hypothetical protein
MPGLQMCVTMPGVGVFILWEEWVWVWVWVCVCVCVCLKQYTYTYLRINMLWKQWLPLPTERHSDNIYSIPLKKNKYWQQLEKLNSQSTPRGGRQSKDTLFKQTLFQGPLAAGLMVPIPQEPLSREIHKKAVPHFRGMASIQPRWQSLCHCGFKLSNCTWPRAMVLPQPSPTSSSPWTTTHAPATRNTNRLHS